MRYLDVSLELPNDSNREISAVFLKKHVMQAVKKLFGAVGAKSQVDILKYNVSDRRFVLRCQSDSYVRLRAALTLASDYEGEPCVYTVHKASANLLSLAADSRTFIH
nr:ribonuclease P protein subunit p14 [Neodiprion pinetum]